MNNALRSMHWKKVIGLLMLWQMLSIQPALAETWHEQLPQAKAIGRGELTWFGLRIYSAVLWSEQQPFDQHAPFVIELTYHRSISQERFLQTSMDEIKRLTGMRYSPEKLQQWENSLRTIFPNVEPGDQLAGVYLPHYGCRFYSKRALIGEIHDVELAQAFFSIWLDEKSQDKELRSHLLGAKN